MSAKVLYFPDRWSRVQTDTRDRRMLGAAVACFSVAIFALLEMAR